jgi:hypothetical protein
VAVCDPGCWPTDSNHLTSCATHLGNLLGTVRNSSGKLQKVTPIRSTLLGIVLQMCGGRAQPPCNDTLQLLRACVTDGHWRYQERLLQLLRNPLFSDPYQRNYVCCDAFSLPAMLSENRIPALLFGFCPASLRCQQIPKVANSIRVMKC